MAMILRFYLLVALAMLPVASSAQESKCFGTTSHGRLEGGVSLPLSGKNFTAYSTVGWGLGRAHVHSVVNGILVEAFEALEKSAPDKTFVYGETGWKNGGRFKPHKTHQNGLSVDLMVPVLFGGTSVPLPGSALNRYGYDIEFNDQGKYEEYAIDFEALGELIYQVHVAAKARGVGIDRVIFEVPLQKRLWGTRRGTYLRQNVTFSTKQAWVRHDEHIHIDFGIRCGRM
jgi:penicillin-insensitive murein endopeptidase